MLIDNYNNSLPENKETGLSFLVKECPNVFVRKFPFRLKPGDNLIIPYYVSSPDNRDIAEDKVGPTFTTIVELDADTVPAEEVQVIKQTTYAGDYMLDLGQFDLDASERYKVHSFSIRAIQSNGISSCKEFFRFIVERERSNILDLNTTLSFQSSLDGTEDCANKYVNLEGAGTHLIKTIANYTVQCSNITSPDFQITVTVDGIREHYKNSASGDERAEAYDEILSNGSKPMVYTISNTYKDSNNVSRSLIDALSLSVSELDDNAISKAIENKHGLAMLLEACKAYTLNGTESSRVDKVILPKDMVVVLDYRNFKNSEFTTAAESLLFPSDITVDFNGLTLKSLQTPLGVQGALTALSNNFNTQLINGKIVGNYDGYDFSKPNSHPTETLCLFTISGCDFCMIDNMDLSGSVGYDSNFSRGKYQQINHDYRKECKFDRYGYIDYDGVEHTFSPDGPCGVNDYTPDDSGFESSMCCTSMYTSAYPSYKGSAVMYYTSFKIFGKRLCFSDDTYPNESFTKPTRRHLSFFVHYYKIGENNKKIFLKTEKVMTYHTILMPYGADTYRLSAIGGYKFGDRDSVNADYKVKNNNTGEVLNYGRARLTPGWRHDSWACEMNNCKFHDNRTCIFDHVGVQCSVDSCLMWNVAAERLMTQGGNHVTKAVIDIEDNANDNYNLYINNCESVFGDAKGVTVHYGYNLCFTNNRGFSPTFKHGLYGAQVDRHIGTLVKEHRYLFPVDYGQISNSYLPLLRNTILIGNADGCLYLRYCDSPNESGTSTYTISPAAIDRIYKLHCKQNN